MSFALKLTININIKAGSIGIGSIGIRTDTMVSVSVLPGIGTDTSNCCNHTSNSIIWTSYQMIEINMQQSGPDLPWWRHRCTVVVEAQKFFLALQLWLQLSFYRTPLSIIRDFDNLFLLQLSFCRWIFFLSGGGPQSGGGPCAMAHVAHA